jgi:hypothetical protein
VQGMSVDAVLYPCRQRSAPSLCDLGLWLDHHSGCTMRDWGVVWPGMRTRRIPRKVRPYVTGRLTVAHDCHLFHES